MGSVRKALRMSLPPVRMASPSLTTKSSVAEATAHGISKLTANKAIKRDMSGGCSWAGWIARRFPGPVYSRKHLNGERENVGNELFRT